MSPNNFQAEFSTALYNCLHESKVNSNAGVRWQHFMPSLQMFTCLPKVKDVEESDLLPYAKRLDLQDNNPIKKLKPPKRSSFE